MTRALPEPQTRSIFFKWLWLVWAVVLYFTLLIGLYSTATRQPQQLQGWAGVQLFCAIGLFLITYHLMYRPTEFAWPLPYRRALIYFSIQIAVYIFLLMHGEGFDGIGYVLLGQIFGSLAVRQWVVPAVGIAALLPVQLGIYDQVAHGNWFALIMYFFSCAIWLVISLMMNKLFEQSFVLRGLVTELRQAKAELEASALQKEELATLRERTRLAREMHDSIGHALVVVNVKLEAAERLYIRDSARGAAELEATRSLVRETMADLRRSLANLRTPLFNHHGLPKALRQIANDTQARTHLVVETCVSSTLPELTSEISETIMRIAKEALHNAEQHAAAASVMIELEIHNDCLLLRVSDDGSGITPAALNRSEHYGIIGMRERVAALGGSLQITSRVGGGTVVQASIPLANRQ